MSSKRIRQCDICRREWRIADGEEEYDRKTVTPTHFELALVFYEPCLVYSEKDRIDVCLECAMDTSSLQKCIAELVQERTNYYVRENAKKESAEC